MDEKRFGANVAALRRARGLTQEALAVELRVTTQAVSKWENGRSLPETALLPEIARLLDCGLDELFSSGELSILEARYGDGLGDVSVAKRLARLVEDSSLDIRADEAALGAFGQAGRVNYLIVKYMNALGEGWAVCREGERLRIGARTEGESLPASGLRIAMGSYGARERFCDAMPKVRHVQPMGWREYPANCEAFPSDPANDCAEYLTLVYLNADGAHVATCAEGESLVCAGGGARLERRVLGGSSFLQNLPALPQFGEGMECSWGAALTLALNAMGREATYEEVMGASGACYRLAFCSPGWDYSSVDGLVAYDYATPGFAAFGYSREMYGRVEKSERTAHRARIAREIRAGMPVLGINLRVAAEWGVICGYAREGEELFCRTKYDAPELADEKFIAARAENHGYMSVDNWPFLLCYFKDERPAPSGRERLLKSLRVFSDCAERERAGGYYMGFKAYEVWAGDLRDDAFYAACDDEAFARRFSVNQFCALSLYDARRCARAFLEGADGLLPGSADDDLRAIAAKFAASERLALAIHTSLDSGESLDGEMARRFWTRDMRLKQAAALEDMLKAEREALSIARGVIAELL